LLHEHLNRRSTFRDGVKIRLADGQFWTLPAPLKASERASFGTEYRGLIKAIAEAEDSSEQRLAELAFAIFLLSSNYHPSSLDYEFLLGFAPGSPESTAAQLAFHHVAQEHLQSLRDASGALWASRQVVPTPGRFSRFFAWLRNHMPFVSWSFDSRGY
jgi:hypothetical protein